MKIANIIARILLGLVFVVFGLNGFLHFIPTPPPAHPLAEQFSTALNISGYMKAVSALQILGGALVLAGFFVPLGLTILCPIIVNIFLFHALMAPEGLLMAVVTALLALFLVWRYWGNFAPIVRQNA